MTTLTLTDHEGRERTIPFPVAHCSAKKQRTQDAGTRLTRCIWLTATVLRRGHVDFEAYRARFNVSLRTYRRDLGALHDVGFCLISVRTSRGAGRVKLQSLNLDGGN